MSAHPWYQFSLRSLLLLILFVAVLCSLGIYTHWLVSTLIALTVTIGGITGRIVAGTRSGFAQGIVFAVTFLFLSVFIDRLVEDFESVGWASWQVCTVAGLVALVGGIVGGLLVRPRSGP